MIRFFPWSRRPPSPFTSIFRVEGKYQFLVINCLNLLRFSDGSQSLWPFSYNSQRRPWQSNSLVNSFLLLALF
ncbi:hypothetical protein Nepgr_010749 [Nepenthes gracilis]|uniref:Uncharacterized protein n=1 Tax=Nepenthes gracilis TaxID=150966 RepID=A0AAD3XLM1_NEPGR|nr:hypothetical protein Nepgr_010749 [Nepenthes gracilis]